MSFLASIQNFNNPWFPGGVPKSDGNPLNFLSADGTFKGPGSALGGTVTSVALTMPAEFAVAGSPITTAGTLAVTKATQVKNTFYAGPASGANAAPTFRALDPADITALGGPFVRLQPDPSPGTPDTGNFNISGTGIIGTGLIVSGDGTGVALPPAPFDYPTVVRIVNTIDGNALYAEAQENAIIGNSTTFGYGIYGFGTGGVGASATTGIGIFGESASSNSAFFKHSSGANTTPTVLIAGTSPQTGPLLSLRSTSALDGATTSRICLSDTNTATTLSNACIAFVPQAGAAGRLGIFTGGTDNDTPGTEFLSVDGAGVVFVNGPALGFNPQGAFAMAVGGAAYFDAQSKFNSGILMGGNLDMGGANITNGGSLSLGGGIDLTGNGTISNFGSALDLGNNGLTNSGNITGANSISGFGAGEGLHWSDASILRTGTGTLSIGVVAVFDDPGQLVTFVNGGVTIDQLDTITCGTGTSGGFIGGQVAIGQAAFGSHALDVTGDAAVTTDFTAAVLHVTAMPAAAGAAGTLYADPITHAVFISP